MIAKRDPVVDVLKGICIFEIVCSHFGHKILWFCFISVYSFYFIAGYTFMEKPVASFVKKIVCRLYFPFVATCFFDILIVKILSKITDGYYYVDLSLKTIIKVLLFNIPSYDLSPAWFVFPYAIILCMYYVMNKIIKNKYVILSISFLVYCIVFYFRDILVYQIWNNCAWIINVSVGLLLFSCGKIVKTNQKIHEFVFDGKYSIDCFLVSTIALYIMWQYGLFNMDTRAGVINSFFYNTLVCIFGMIFVFNLSKYVSKSKMVSSFFRFLGKHSMPIMYYHILSASIVTILANKILGFDYPNVWNKAFNSGVLSVINIVLGLTIPLAGSVIHKIITKTRLHECVRSG